MPCALSNTTPSVLAQAQRLAGRRRRCAILHCSTLRSQNFRSAAWGSATAAAERLRRCAATPLTQKANPAAGLCSTLNGAAASNRPRVLGLVELCEVSSTVVCMLTTADSHSTREEGYEPQLHHGSRDSALHLPVEPGGVPVPLLFSFSSTTINGF